MRFVYVWKALHKRPVAFNSLDGCAFVELVACCIAKGVFEMDSVYHMIKMLTLWIPGNVYI